MAVLAGALVAGDGHEGRPQHAVADGVAALQHADDGAVGHARVVLVGDGLLRVRVEGLALAAHGQHALGLEQAAQLAVDDPDALHPGRVAHVVGHMLDGQVEVVGELEDTQQEPVARGGREVGALLLGAPLQVGVVRAGALPAGLGLIGPRQGGRRAAPRAPRRGRLRRPRWCPGRRCAPPRGCPHGGRPRASLPASRWWGWSGCSGPGLGAPFVRSFMRTGDPPARS